MHSHNAGRELACLRAAYAWGRHAAGRAAPHGTRRAPQAATLKRLLEAGAAGHCAELSAIAAAAGREGDVGRALDAMAAAWEGRALEVDGGGGETGPSASPELRGAWLLGRLGSFACVAAFSLGMDCVKGKQRAWLGAVVRLQRRL